MVEVKFLLQCPDPGIFIVYYIGRNRKILHDPVALALLPGLSNGKV
ncbi:MAG TPA: hypothetical protein PKD26_02160 [Pyrinomonadaceae bacterium]|nr:hypothetical protein [Pyrinomonadaceae bacterium]